MLALLAALLAFAYATLSLRRLFQGEYIGAWREFGQVETYAYSALWLVLGVALLVGGAVPEVAGAAHRLRRADRRSPSPKVFLFDMSELEGVLRALSFIGLGIVLIGIGLFYQRMLTRAGSERLLRSRRNRKRAVPTGRSLIGQCTIAANRPSATPSHHTGS